jgi:hypothetical protein
VGAVALAAYLVTLQRSVPGGDSGELIAATVTGGVAHPPGYPLFLLLGRLTAAVPVGSIAMRVNALSAVCDAAAAGLLTLAVARLSGRVAGGLLAGGLFAFSTRVWAYATVAEVFALNNLVMAGLLGTLALAGPRATVRHVASAAALMGLGLANHHTSIFVSTPIVAWLLVSAWRAGTGAWRLLAVAAGCGLAGLAPYAYLPLAAARDAWVSWGEPASLAGFLRHLTRAEYGTFRLASAHVGAATSAVGHVVTYLRDLLSQSLWVGAALAPVGAWAGLRAPRTRGAVLAVLVGLIGYVVVFNALSNLPLDVPLLFEVQARFWQMPNLLVFALAGLGLAALAPARLAAAALAVATAVAGVQAARNFASMDESQNRWVESYGRSILAAAPPGALILSRGDLITNVLLYLRFAEGLRPDVRIVDQEILSLGWGPSRYARLMPEVRFPAAVYDPHRADGFSMAQFLDANAGRSPIAVCGGFKPGDPSVPPRAYRLQPRGICTEIARPGQPLAVDRWLEETRPLLPAVEPIARAVLPPGSWEELVRRDVWAAWHDRAYFVLTCADCGLAPAERHTRFVALAEEILRLGPQPPLYVYRNLGYALTELFATRPEVRDRLVAAYRDYLRMAPPGDPDVPTVRDNLRRLGGAP